MTLSNSGKRLLYWGASAAWVAVIFLTLPYAPIWREWIAEHLYADFFSVLVIAILAVVLAATIMRMIRTKAALWDYTLLAAIAVCYVYGLSRITIAVEQVHFVEYGVLACLFIAALRVDWRDPGQYFNALLLVTLVGIADEYVQGTLPNRVGELHDVYLNVISGALALAWFRFCLRLSELPSSLQTILRVALPVIGLIIVSIGIFNSRISEFGYYIKDPEIGEFYSRLPQEKLTAGVPGGEFFKSEILPQLYQGSYSQLLYRLKGSIYGEVLVHIFSRDKHLERGDLYPAYRENQILEKYFPNFINGTKYQWTMEKQAKVEEAVRDNLDKLYVSPVSAHIITSFSETAQWIIVGVLEVGLLMLWLTAVGRKRARSVG
jgi:VanZ family protein